MIDRRQFVLAAGAAAIVPGAARANQSEPTRQFAALERAAGGRLGVCVLDTATGRRVGWRAAERFCHCSTFKFSLAAMALHESDAGRLNLAETLRFGHRDLIDYSPVVEANLAKGGLSVADLAAAAQQRSDNSAANLVMRRLGGPAALTRFWRLIGDPVSRLDAYEPALNVIPLGTQENSTTPNAMAETMRRIVLGDVLRADSRARLRDWMAATHTGNHRLRTGIPADWQLLDKTGTGGRAGTGNKINDIAVLFPPDRRAPLVVTAYYENPAFSDGTRPADEAVLARVGAIAAAPRRPL